MSVRTIRTIGTGEIERVAIVDSTSNKDDSCFVVRNFRAATSKLLHHNDPSPSKTKTATVIEHGILAIRTDSNCSLSEGGIGEEMVYDLTTDLAYHDSSEREGAELVHRALTDEEQKAMPDAFMPLRHYRAEKGDVAKAIDAIKYTLRWRKEFRVDKLVSALEDDAKNLNHKPNEQEEDFAAILRKENVTGKVYSRGYDKDGRAMMYMRPASENTMHENNNMLNLVFQIEKAIACSQKNGQGKICVLIDYNGFSMSTLPSMSSSRRSMDILQRHFCERMYRVYIFNPPFVFRSFYAMVKPLLDPVTKQKICWCVGKEMDKVVDDIGGPEKAATQLKKCCGGSENLRDFDPYEYDRLPLTVTFDEKVIY